MNASALNRQFIFQVTHCTEPCELTVGARKPEYVTFHLFNSAQYDIILGYPWLTSPKVVFQWSPEADKAFQRLRTAFTTALVLTVPDPQRQFMVELDASNGIMM